MRKSFYDEDGYFKGQVADVAFYDAVLSTEQVADIQNTLPTSGNDGKDDSGKEEDNDKDNTQQIVLFDGNASVNDWNQAVTVVTKRNGGVFTPSVMAAGGSFYVEYEGTKDKLDLILQSWSNGPDWAKVTISESGEINGHYYARFSYENCVNAFGTTDFANNLDRIHVGAAGTYVKVYRLQYEGSWESLFWGEAYAENWNQSVSVYTAKNGGSFSASNIKPGGHFYVEYSGTKDKLDFVLQSWSGASTWGKVKRTASGEANGHYYATYSYENCVEALGSSDFSNLLDRIHVSAAGESITVYSLCYDYGK